MADPILPEGVSEIAKLGGSGAAGSFLTLLMGRLFGGQDKVITRLDALQLSVMELAQQLAVMGAGTSRRDLDVGEMRALLAEHARQFAEHAKQLARLEAKMEQISEGQVLR